MRATTGRSTSASTTGGGSGSKAVPPTWKPTGHPPPRGSSHLATTAGTPVSSHDGNQGQLSWFPAIPFFNYLLLLVTIGAVNRSAYYYTELLSLLFLQTPFSVGNNTRIVTFDGVTTMRHFWGFLENPMIEGLYRSSIITTTKAEIAGQDRKVLNENKVLGVPRLRQLRVRNDSCEVPAIFTRTFSTCYDAYSSAAEEKEPFGPRNTTAWRYTSSEELDGISYMGTISNYHGGGYYQDLSIVPNETINIVASLKKNLWINRSTRAVFLDFTVYNANINLFCVIKLLFELPPTGGVLSSHDFTTMKLIRYVEPLDYAVMGFEFLFIFFVLFFTMEEVIEMMFFKLQYLFHFWNYIDLVILLILKAGGTSWKHYLILRV
ncbi:polycystin-2-like [Schistocerca piceifrons]|uniref:polycystin-2-like n=1 Tax=Schistocerca piceifrons TaxID=274613 RepID=UPI001F5E7D00|nr:polycystin-2-like [Schistocerca piceifrons]